MDRLEFFITRDESGYRLLDGNGDDHCGLRFETAALAADMAVRLAQELGVLYVVYY